GPGPRGSTLRDPGRTVRRQCLDDRADDGRGRNATVSQPTGTQPCTQPGCTGTIMDGYCDVCGNPPGAAPAAQTTRPPADSPPGPRTTPAPAPGGPRPPPPRAGGPARRSARPGPPAGAPPGGPAPSRPGCGARGWGPGSPPSRPSRCSTRPR